MHNFEVEFFRKQDGSCPVEAFLETLDMKMKAKILRLVFLLEKNGNELREPYSKALGDGIFEVRATQGTDISRVFYFFVAGHKIVLTNGFIKKTKKTPRAELNMAKRYRAEYLSRKGEW